MLATLHPNGTLALSRPGETRLIEPAHPGYAALMRLYAQHSVQLSAAGGQANDASRAREARAAADDGIVPTDFTALANAIAPHVAAASDPDRWHAAFAHAAPHAATLDEALAMADQVAGKPAALSPGARSAV
jgi:hypothetical protein